MKKIPTLFKRDPDDMSLVTDEVNPEAKWVLDGEGVATRKYDGTCVMLDDDGHWWARREVKPGKTPPPNWVEADHDETTGKRPGWEPIGQSPFAKFHAEALGAGAYARSFTPGTYELVGPKINGNPEGCGVHQLIRHADAEPFGLANNPAGRDAAAVVELVKAVGRDGWEGIVWHHLDGRMAKLKARDYESR